MASWDAWIGRAQEQEDHLTPASLQRFRATFDQAGGDAGVPQGVHWCLCTPEASTATLGIDGHPRKGGFMPPIAQPRRMWASSAVTFHAPLSVGGAILRRTTIAGVAEKVGSTGSLIFVTLDHETFVDGVLAVSDRQSLVYRDAPTPVTAPTAPPAPPTMDAANWPVERIITPSEALLFRYSALTFNTHRIHYDAPYAVAEEGYSGLVVHGPLTATLLLDLAARTYGPNCLASFSMRGQSPAIVGEPLHLQLRADGAAITFQACDATGRVIMSAQGVLAQA
jgi:3-methylfumaryl-CoA hydratase